MAEAMGKLEYPDIHPKEDDSLGSSPIELRHPTHNTVSEPVPMLDSVTITSYSALLSHLYDGHLEEDPYSQFLDQLRTALELSFASITLREPVDADGGLLFVSSDVLQKTYVDDHSNPYTDRYYTSNVMSNLPWREVVTLDECMSYSQLEETDIYRVCMEPVNIYHMAGIDLRNANGQRFSVRFCRPRDAHNFTPEERAFLKDLGGHIQRAVSNGMQLIQLDNERRLYARTISGRSIGIITLDERARIINCNQAANEIIAAKDGISIVNDQLMLNSDRSRSKFGGYVEEIIRAQRQQETTTVNAMTVERPSGEKEYELLIKPLSVDRNVEPAHTPYMMVFISDPAKRYEVDIRMLTLLYELTRAEAMLAKHLASGLTLDQCSAELGIARNTARAQLRSIFAKTGVTQQSMLVSLILKSLAAIS